VIYKALARDPKDRYVDMGAFHQGLAELISADGKIQTSLGSGDEKPNVMAEEQKGRKKKETTKEKNLVVGHWCGWDISNRVVRDITTW
jgi:hypothetical protein